MERILDAHCHIYPLKIASKAVDSIGEFYHISMDMNGTPEMLECESIKAGITDVLIHSVSTTPRQVRSINEFIAQEVKKNPEHRIGFGTLHPGSEDIEGDIEQLISLGLRGVKLHPDFQHFAIDSDEAINLCKNLEGRLPVLVHAGDSRFNYSNPKNIYNIMNKLPNLTLIAAHFGGYSVWDDAKEVLAGIPNLYVDTSSSFFKLSNDEILELIEAYGVDKILFGSDYPMWTPVRELERFYSLGLSRVDERKILWDNSEIFRK